MTTITRFPCRVTWLGHATFLLQSPGGKRILVDPWVTANPSCPESAKKIGALDLMLITHGHSDHTGRRRAIGRSTGAQRRSRPTKSVGVAAEKGLQNTSPA